MDSSKYVIRNASNQLIGLLVACTMLSGCPRKLTEKVVVTVEKPCPPPPPKKADPPIANLVTVAVVQSAGVEKAVIASAGFAKVIAVGEPIGAERAVVTAIAPDGITVRMPNTSSLKIKWSERLAGVAAQPDQPVPQQAQPHVLPAPELANLIAWRKSVVGFVTGGYGVPVDVLLAVSIAHLDDDGSGKTHSVISQLKWPQLAGIRRATVTRLAIKDGTITLDGVAPDKATAQGILARLKAANPLISAAQMVASGPIRDGFKYSISLEAPRVKASDIAVAGSSPGTPLPPAARADLDKLAATIPGNAAMGGAEADLKVLAASSGLTVASLARSRQSITEGYLGTVNFKLSATGTGIGLLKFLGNLRLAGRTQRPVVVDPLVVAGQKIEMTIRVPFVAGNTDSRVPAPTVLMLPKLSNPVWDSVRKALPLDTLRDAFLP